MTRLATTQEFCPAMPGCEIAPSHVDAVIPAARGLRGERRNVPPYGGSRNGS